MRLCIGYIKLNLILNIVFFIIFFVLYLVENNGPVWIEHFWPF